MSTARQAPMLSIPLKATDDVELSTPLRHFIRNNYGSVEKYAEECTTINRLRQDMRGAGKDEMGRNLLYRYYGQLELLELRFPIDEEHVRIAFNWYDAFTESPISQYSLAYEKACVLFNIASVLSFTATTQIRSEVEGMKRAYHSLQACAGLLNFINENFLHAPSTDLSREMVKTLSTVMLAQAQEVFTEKQIRDGGKNSIIAKLAAECASLYHNANETLGELIIAGTIDAVWCSFCQIKEKYFASLAQFYQAGFEAEKTKYGSAVARLTSAQVLLKEASSAAKSHSGQFSRYPALSNEPGVAFIELLKTTTEIVNEKLNTVRRENDVIYHEAVPKESALVAVTRLASAKAISLHDLFKGQDISRIIGPDIFQKLVPLSVHESASMYSEEIAKLLRSEQERSSIADTELSTALDYLGLPKSLHQFKMSDARMGQDLSIIPTHLQHLAQQVALQERQDPLNANLQKVKTLRDRIATSIAQATKALDEEGLQCEAMRAKFRDTWTQAPSRTLTQGLRDDLQKCRASLQAASASDERLESQFLSIQSDLMILANSDAEELNTSFQRIVMESSSSVAPGTSLLDLPTEDNSNDIAIKVDQVDDIVRKLNLVKKERLQTLQDLKERARKDDISDVLILNKKNPEIEQRVFAAELEKFNPHRTRISATISRQEELIEEMTATFTAVLDDKTNQARQNKWAKASKQRNDLIEKLEKAAQIYQDLAPGLLRAKAFYTDLDNLIKTVDQSVNGFVQSRQQEGRRLFENKNRQQQHPERQSDSLRDRLEQLSFSNAAYTAPGLQRSPPSADQYRRPY